MASVPPKPSWLVGLVKPCFPRPACRQANLSELYILGGKLSLSGMLGMPGPQALQA